MHEVIRSFLPQHNCRCGSYSLAGRSTRVAATAAYATKIYIGQDVEISLYSPTMFRFRISQAQPERFPAKYEIPFVMGRLAPWPEVKYQRWTAGEFEWIETSGSANSCR